MQVSNIHRASITKDRVFKARCSCRAHLLAERPSITQPRQIFPSQSRALWWWSRRANEWSTYLDEHLRTRLQRERKIMRYKYSKALRRRALWESEVTYPHWGWRVPSHWARRRLRDGESMSSSSRLWAGVQEPQKDEPSLTRPLENQYSEEFARFKAAVDKDPFVAVFGKRLEGPPSSNNSSWTSLLRIFESAPAEDGPSTKSAPRPSPNQSSASPDGNSNVAKQGSTNAAADMAGAGLSHATSAAKPDMSCKEEEYEFDPISMKKVPKVKLDMQPPTQNEQKSFLSTLFSEHGVEIPVKTYKPHKVYGYTEREESEAENKSGTVNPGKKSENSRIQQLQNLRATKLGNAVDATNFCGKYQVKDDNDKGTAFDTNKSTSASEAPVEDAPLFSGTTYESKSQTIVAPEPAPKKDWLADEGFRTSSSNPKPSSMSPQASALAEKRGPSEPVSRIEPSLDRRLSASAKVASTERSPKQAMLVDSENDQTEDLDLLKPSDVRAQFKSSRRARHDGELNKKETRERLEADYGSRQQSHDKTDLGDEDPVAVSARKFQEGLSSLWKRVRNQPQYTNLANTIKNMGVFQDAWKKYARDRSIGDPNEKLVFKDQNLSKTPSIYKKTTSRSAKAIDTFTPSQEVLEAEKESGARTAALRAASEKAKREEAEQKRQDIELASEIRNAYESQYGRIDVNHRQVDSVAEINSAKPEGSGPNAVGELERQQTPEFPRPSSNVPRSPPESVADIEKVTQADSPRRESKTLQPEIDRLAGEVRNTRRVLHEVSLHVKAIKSCRPPTYWNTPVAEDSAETSASTVVPGGGKSSAQSQSMPLDIKNTPEGAAQDIAAYTASVVSANQSTARAQATQEMRARHTNPVQPKQERVPPVASQDNDLSESANPKTEASQAERVNEIQAQEKAAVEASVDSLTQEKAKESKDNSSKRAATAVNTNPATMPPDTTSSSRDVAAPDQQVPGLYKILAYDSSTLQISMATTTSSLSASASGTGDIESPLHPTEVLSRLNNPAKFLPYFQGLQNEGYEIVSGSGDILVFKKVREVLASSNTDAPIQTATTTAKQPDAPTQKEAATVLEEFPSKPAPAPPAPPSSPIVYRQEDVFSGAGKTWHWEETQSESSFGSKKPSEGSWYGIKRGLRRIFFTGLATAGVAYAIGAVAEFFGAQQQPLYEEGQPRRGVRPGIYSTESSR
jgi:hypothetical protein